MVPPEAQAEDYKKWCKLVDPLQSIPGIYAVFAGECLLYIGQATRIRHRLQNHHRWLDLFQAGATEIRHIVVENYFDRMRMEAYLIDKHRPNHNRNRGIWNPKHVPLSFNEKTQRETVNHWIQ